MIVVRLPGRAGVVGACALGLGLLWPQVGKCQFDPAALSFGGTLAVTSDYIYRGVSQSDGQGAAQVDLHVGTAGGTFLGVWASTRDQNLAPGTEGETQLYLGQRFNLGGAWSATLSGRADYYVGGSPYHSDDYQEISAALSWADRFTFSLGVIPSAVRYRLFVYEESPGEPLQYFYFPYRSPAFEADASGQWLLLPRVFRGALYATAAAGYYDSTAPGGRDDTNIGYLYGNAGLALQWRHWRIDVGYFAAQSRAAELFPYPVANRAAGTVSWQF